MEEPEEAHEAANEAPSIFKYPITDDEMKEVFIAKCEEFKINFSDKLFERFLRHQSRKQFRKTFVMENSALGPRAAQITARIMFDHQNFRVISLSGNAIGNEGAMYFADLLMQHRSLISLDLSSNGVGDLGAAAIFRSLRKNTTLIHLKLGSSTGVSRNSFGIQAATELCLMLRENNVLSSLDISMAEINSEIVEPITSGLAMNKTLQSLDISNNNIRSRGAVSIINSCTNSRLTTLRLATNHIKDDCGPHFANFLNNNSVLKCLDLSGNNLTNKFVNAIAIPLSSTSVIQELNLSRNPLGGRGISVLGPALATNSTLKKLNIAAVKCSASGFAEFCLEFQRNQALEVLDCQHNPIRDEGATKLSIALKALRHIKELNLELCEIGDDGAKMLFTVIATHPSLSTVSIKNNLIRDGVCIQKAVNDNPRLVILDIEYNDIEYKTFTEIQRLTALNFRNWRVREKDKMADEVEELNSLDGKLAETRMCITEERDTIVVLTQQLAESRQRLEDAAKSSMEHIGILEKRNDEMQGELNKQTNEQRTKDDELRSAVSAVETEVNATSNRLAREVEKGVMMTKALAQLESRIAQTMEENKEALKELEKQLHEAKVKYKDCQMMFMGSFEQRKEELKAEQLEKEAMEAAEKAAANPKAATKGKKGAKGKGKGKGKAKGKGKKGKGNKLADAKAEDKPDAAPSATVSTTSVTKSTTSVTTSSTKVEIPSEAEPTQGETDGRPEQPAE